MLAILNPHDNQLPEARFAMYDKFDRLATINTGANRFSTGFCAKGTVYVILSYLS
jgi:hypothetical protein